jgi:hypothetical protein
MQQDLANKIDVQRETAATTNDYISQLVTGRATLSLNLNRNDGGSSIISTTSSPSTQHQQEQPQSAQQQQPQSTQQQQPQSSSHERPPFYKMSQGIRTITDLHREWYVGLAGGFSVASLEQEWGTKWRNDQGEKILQQTTPIINTIKTYAEQHNITIETAVGIAEERRVRLKKSLHYLAENNDKIFD